MPKTDRSRTRPAEPRGGLRRFAIIGSIALLGAMIVAIAIDVGTSQAEIREQRTGRIGPMGGPVLDVPIDASGVATAAGIEVVGSELAMGDVGLNVTVEPTWTLVNAGTEPVQLGEPHASVVEGCCPGPLTLGTNVLSPGEATVLTFPLQMHQGMDGPHAFRIHIPVGDSGEVLELGVTGDFHA